MKQISSGWTRKLLLLDVHHLDDLLDHPWSAHVQVAEAKASINMPNFKDCPNNEAKDNIFLF